MFLKYVVVCAIDLWLFILICDLVYGVWVLQLLVADVYRQYEAWELLAYEVCIAGGGDCCGIEAAGVSDYL